YNLVAGLPWTYASPQQSVLSEAVVEEPTLMVAFLDNAFGRDAYPVGIGLNFEANFCRSGWVSGRGCPPENSRFGRHLDGINAVYMDGHVKWNRVDHFYNNGENYPVWQGWK